MNHTIFDFEQNLLDFANVTKDINVLYGVVLEGDPSLDKIANVLLGLRELYDMKFDMLWATFEQLTKEYYEFKNSNRQQGVYTEETVSDYLARNVG